MEEADLLVIAIMQSLISSVSVMQGAVNSLLIQRYKRKRAKSLHNQTATLISRAIALRRHST